MSRRKGNPDVDGVLVVDKPSGMSSYDVIRRLKRVLGTGRLGHTGTLDPMATGVLVVCAGWSTRLVPYLSDGWKTYEGVITLGVSTETDDAEGAVVVQRPVSASPEDVRREMAALTGAISQVPPAHSAVKVDGERAYAAARRGEVPELRAREITVRRFERTSTEGAEVGFVAEVSRGTYIRSLARDLGEALGCGAHLSALRRTANEPFVVSEARQLDDVAGPADLVSAWDALRSMPGVVVSARDVASIRQGRAVAVPEGAAEMVKVASEEAPETLAAICRVDAAAGCLRPVRVRPVAAEA